MEQNENEGNEEESVSEVVRRNNKT